MATPYPLGTEELQGLLRRSHQLVVGKLPKRTQVGLLL
jgi:predicted DNA-binding protein (MmcQ/YjbR family)